MKSEKVYHTTVEDALADGWIRPYMGGHCEGVWDCRGRVYGWKKGNHRLFRCYRLNQPKPFDISPERVKRGFEEAREAVRRVDTGEGAR